MKMYYAKVYFSISSLNKAGSLMKMYYAKVYFSKLGDETNTYYHALRSSVFDLFIVCIALWASVPDLRVTKVLKMTVISYTLCLSTCRVTLDITI